MRFGIGLHHSGQPDPLALQIVADGNGYLRHGPSPFSLCALSSAITQLAETAIGLQDVSLTASDQRELRPIA